VAVGGFSVRGSCALDRYEGCLWTVPVDLGGRIRRFLFDLGAGVTSLDTRLAESLGLSEVRRVAGRRMTGTSLNVPLLEPTTLTIAGRAFETTPGRIDLAALLPPQWMPVDGVLALDVLEHIPFSVDLATGRLSFNDISTEGLQLLEVRLHRQIPGVSLVVLIAALSPEGNCWLELDNSNIGPTILSIATARRLGIAPDFRETTLHLSGLQPFRTPISVTECIYDGNLGRSFTDGRRFVFELARGRAWASPSV
jgi:hypothetical protein